MTFGLARVPDRPVDVPTVVARLAAGRELAPVWENQLGGITWHAEDIHIKWNPRATGIDLAVEVDRLRWVAGWIRCPVVVEFGADDGAQWMVTETIRNTRTAIAATGAEIPSAVESCAGGLRRLHDAAPVAECPFSWSTERRQQRALDRLARGEVDPAQLHPQHQHLATAEINERLLTIPVFFDPALLDDVVVCHGDACTPNTLIGPGGRFAGLVDLGSLGVGRRWAELAAAVWSLEWNFGEGWDNLFLDSYGIDPSAADPDGLQALLAYHQLLWDLGTP